MFIESLYAFGLTLIGPMNRHESSTQTPDEGKDVRYIDYREYDPEAAIALTREYARDAYIDTLDMCDTLLDEGAFIDDYVSSYMDGAAWSDQRLDACERALAEVERLRDERDELRNSLEIARKSYIGIWNGCSIYGFELHDDSGRDAAFYSARLGEVEAELWEAIDAYSVMVAD